MFTVQHNASHFIIIHYLCCTGVRDVRSPLHWACVGGHKDMVKCLVEKANCDVSE